MKDYPETHQHGHIAIENSEQLLGITHGDFGIQIAKDGRVWICFNGVSVIRFKPESSKVAVSVEQVGKASMEGSMIVKCPVCKRDVQAEPDAEAVYCLGCGEKIEIDNPIFKG